MSKLIVYKASAGSGKTFTLAVEYICLLIDTPLAYRNILAVTFTNKATAEMKDRILSVLYGLAFHSGDEESYLKEIIKKTGRAENEIREGARKALSNILHDYNHFRIETIDSFFQSVMRNLARELDLSPSFNIELDTTKVLEDAVDQMLTNLTENAKEMKGILDYIEENISEDKQWDITKQVKAFGKNLFNEIVMSATNFVNDNSDIVSLNKELRYKLKSIKDEAKSFSERYNEIINQCNVDISTFSNGNDIPNYFHKISDCILEDKTKGARISKKIDDVDAWYKKTDKKHLLEDVVRSKLQPLLLQAEKFRADNIVIINSINITLQHLNKIVLLGAIKEEIIKTNKQKNRFLLAETNNLLHHIVKDNDSSFVFEKIGSNIQNVMIDEFQDTSRMQWSNFKMLLIEGLSQGADSLIVGDVKQSIYRWRNGDWNILNGLKGKFGNFDIYQQSLRVNRRSEKSIITFNNYIFTAAKKYLNDIYKTDLYKDCAELLDAYSDVEQESPHNNNKGYVKISFIGEDKENGLDYVQNTCAQLGNEVKRLLDEGIKLDDIAILVRKNRTIPIIASYFKDELQIRVISDEAFQLESSVAINILIDALRVLANKNDMISAISLSYRYNRYIDQGNKTGIEEITTHHAGDFIPDFFEQRSSLQFLPLYELLEKLYVTLHLESIEGQDAYLFAFFDEVMKYLQNNPSDILSFLSYWEEKLSQKTITGGQLKGLHIYSIHKSKGLQFHTVLIPFCDWTIDKEPGIEQLVWCIPQQEPYNQMKLAPISFSNKMKQSVYSEDFIKERLQLWVDNLNILYVGFTRAEKNLIVIGNSSKANSMSELLQSVLKEQLNEDSVYEIGNSMPSDPVEESNTTTNKFLEEPHRILAKMQSFKQRISFRQSNCSADFINSEEDNISKMHYIDRGKLLHQLFSMISSPQDIDKAIERLIFDGLLDQEEEKGVKGIVQEAFKIPRVKNWYSSEWMPLNEREIIWQEHDEVMSRRPDRVMVKGNEAIVVDFKFGKAEAKYKEQVKIYMKLLQKIGYKKINGYLWYVSDKNIEHVIAN